MREEHQTTPEVEALRAKVANLESMLEKIRGLQRYRADSGGSADWYEEEPEYRKDDYGDFVLWEDLSAIVLHEV